MNAPRKDRASRPELELLDHRILPAGGVTATLQRGLLTIVGTEAADVVNVEVQRGLARRAAARPVVTVEGIGRFRAGQVRRIVVVGSVGDDSITVTDRGTTPLPVRIFGGAGNDAIVGRAVIDSGEGNDLVNGVWDIPPTPVVNPPAPVVPPPPTLPPIEPPSSTFDLSAFERGIIDLTNQARVEAGLAPLRVSTSLTAAARLHAGNMARLDRMEHTLEGVAQPTLVSRAEHVGFDYSWLGENIAFNYWTAAQVVSAWLDSPGHRANILNANYTEIGVAVALNSQGEPYSCQVFGRPA